MLKLALCLQAGVFTLLGSALAVVNCGTRESFEIRAIRSATFRPAAPVQAAGTGNVFFVAVDGSPQGTGTKKRPWDLQTALSHPEAVKAGDTIYLRGGTYAGKFVSLLTGTQSSPIYVRSYHDEWAKIDGYVSTATSSSVARGAGGEDVVFSVVDGSKFSEGSQITIDDEVLYVRRSESNVITAIHGWNGTESTAHAAGVQVTLGGNQLEVRGSDAVYLDFEITNSDPVRTSATANSQNAPRLRGEGVWQAGLRTKLINLVIHDCQEGIFTNANAVDSEIYGCIVYNNGYLAGGVANGHGIYVINDRPTKRIVDSISFNNFSTGIKSVSQNGDSKFIDHQGDIVFNNGSPTRPESAVRGVGILLGANNGFADQNTINGCFFYQPPGTVGGNVRLGFSGENGSIVFTDNLLMGGAQALEVDGWKSLVVSGNTFYITELDPRASSNAVLAQYAPSSEATVLWDNNRYYNGRTVPNSNALYFNFSSAQSFDTWKSVSGFDKNSSYQSGPLEGLQTFVLPNRYDPDRAYVVVYNWDRAEKVKVDLSSFLSRGQAFELRNVQDFFGSPVLSGKYKGKPLKVPMSGRTVAAPVGYEYAPAHTGPEFNVFVLIRR
jgi:hypothetical protein